MAVEVIAIDYVLIVGYFVILLGIGVYFMFSKQATAASYFLADRDANWFQIGAAYYASHLGVETMVALTGAGATVGMSASYFDWLSAMLFLVLAYIYSPFYFKTKVFSTPEYMEKRFGRYCRIYLASVSLVTYALTRIAMALFATAIVLHDLLGWDFWTSIMCLLACCSIFITMGGMSALFASEVVQSFCILLFGILFMIAALMATNGLGTLEKNLPDRFFHMWHEDGHYPWSGLLFGYPLVGFWYYVTDQEIIQRGLAGRTLPDIQAGCLFAAFLKLLAPFMFIVPGMVARYLYSSELECATPDATSCEKADYALTLIAERHLPRGTIGIMAVALLAALMSSIASVFNSIATLATMDLYFVVKGTQDVPDSKVVLIGRVAIIGATIFACVFVPFVYHLSSSLLVAMQTIDSCVGPPISVVFLLSIMSSRISSTAAFVGMICGHIAGITRFFAILASDENSEYATVNFLHFALIEAGITLVVAVVLSYFIPPTPEELKSAVPLTWAGRKQEWHEPVSEEKKSLKSEDGSKQGDEEPKAEEQHDTKVLEIVNAVLSVVLIACVAVLFAWYW